MRWHLAGMAAVWLLVTVLNIDISPRPTANLAQEKLPTPRQLWAALRENRRQLLELMEVPIPAEAAPARPADVPQRRSELESTTAIA